MRHRFHAICPYFAMFPEAFARKHIATYTQRGDWVFDPFCGRGTAVFESLLHGRPAVGCDTSPVAVCVSNAKCNPPTFKAVADRLDTLYVRRQAVADESKIRNNDFFRACFHPQTLEDVLWLRQELDWRNDPVDCYIAALSLGCLHGESHRTQNCFSNRMPRIISTKPEYSIRWWKKNGCVAPKRDVFGILRCVAAYRFASDPAPIRGRVIQADARRSADIYPELRDSVRLLITSPPYLDTTNFREDQWLRLWFLGGDPRPIRSGEGDDRHRRESSYWEFLSEVWRGVAPLVNDNATIVVRIGGRLSREQCHQELRKGLEKGLNRTVHVLQDGHTTAIKGGQLRAFRPGVAGTRSEHDFVFTLAK